MIHIDLLQAHLNGNLHWQIIDHEKELNENTIDAYVCFPSMPENCEYGSIYCFKDLKEAQQSLAWQLKGSLAYAQSLNNLVSQDYQKARSLYEEYQNEFKKGFGNHGLILKWSRQC